MKCQNCNTKEATSHITEIINGNKHEMYLCSECAAKLKTGMDFGIGDFLGGLFGGSKVKLPSEESQKRKDVCDCCGMDFNEFLQKGRLGCGNCYRIFGDRLQRPLKQIHGTCEHIGKVPTRIGGELKISREITKLEAELNQAVLKQEFEKAAELRDEISRLRAENQKEV